MHCDPNLLEAHTRYLTDTIGVRLAGSKAERQAADYLAEQFRQYSEFVTIEEFPVEERAVDSETLELKINGTWMQYPCSLFGGAPSTDGKTVVAPLVMHDTTTGYLRKDLSHLTGKAVLHLGCHFFNEDDYKRLMEAKPAFLLFVDVRHPGDRHLADGLFPAFVRKYGAVPSLNVAYTDAWSWLQQGAEEAKIVITGGKRPSMTSVVVCTMPGSDPAGKIIYAGGHHDTQAGTVGADDNAIGCAAVLELARLLKDQPRKHTLKLCCFGAEEQLSVGSAAYMAKHREEIVDKGLFMCNFDSYGSALGWYEMTLSANAALHKHITKIFHDNGIYFHADFTPCAFTDQFPFAACGVPGIWITRKNCTEGLVYHHREDNTCDKIDFARSANCVTAAANFLLDLSNQDAWDQLGGIPEDQQEQINRLFHEIYE